MATMEDVVQRLDDMNETLNTVTSTQHLMAELLAGQQEQLTAIREDQKTHQEQLTAIREDQKAQQEQLTAIREDLKTHREELREVRRFNEQTRRLWILIARNMEWLPDDECFD